LFPSALLLPNRGWELLFPACFYLLLYGIHMLTSRLIHPLSCEIADPFLSLLARLSHLPCNAPWHHVRAMFSLTVTSAANTMVVR
jgi:hypothetical protein